MEPVLSRAKISNRAVCSPSPLRFTVSRSHHPTNDPILAWRFRASSQISRPRTLIRRVCHFQAASSGASFTEWFAAGSRRISGLRPVLMPDSLDVQTPASHGGRLFVVSGDRLAGYDPTPPPKRPSESWIWRHREAVTHLASGERMWLCRICHDDSAVHHPRQEYILKGKETRSAQRHMARHGYDLDGSKLHTATKRRNHDIGALLTAQENAQRTTFDRDEWKRLFIQWVVMTNQSLRQAVAESHKRLLLYRNPAMEDAVPSGPSTVT